MGVAELTILLPVAAFIALALAVAVVLRRAGRIVARTREVEHFRSAVRDLSARIDRSLEGAAGESTRSAAASSAPMRSGRPSKPRPTPSTRYAEEARSLKGPPAAVPIRDAIVEELERAERALAMVDHGAKIMVQSRRRGRELEAQTSVKRGYLNLIHARDAIAAHALAAEALEVAQPDGAAKGSAPAGTTRP